MMRFVFWGDLAQVFAFAKIRFRILSTPMLHDVDGQRNMTWTNKDVSAALLLNEVSEKSREI